MNRRIHEVLDGERDRRELSSAERARLEEFERAAARALDPLRAEASPDVTESVMARIEELEASTAARPVWSEAPEVSATTTLLAALGRAWAWIWRPREVRVRPAWGVAGALALLLVFAPWESPRQPVITAVPVADGPDAPTVMVQFRLDADEARTVQLAGDFTDWEPAYDMHEVAPGVWSVVVPLPPGVHDYSFVVDGEQWRPDPLAPSVDDGFGGTNSRLALMTPERGGAS